MRLRKASTTLDRLSAGPLYPRDFFDAITAQRSLAPPSEIVQVGLNGVLFAEQHVDDIVHAVRVAVTGKAVGFGLFDTLAILGRERCLARIDRALALAVGG